jgi:hypothetical protein
VRRSSQSGLDHRCRPFFWTKTRGLIAGIAGSIVWLTDQVLRERFYGVLLAVRHEGSCLARDQTVQIDERKAGADRARYAAVPHRQCVRVMSRFRKASRAARCGAVTSIGGLACEMREVRGGARGAPRVRHPDSDAGWRLAAAPSCGKATALAAGCLRRGDARSDATHALRCSARHRRESTPCASPGCSTAGAARHAFRY